MKQLNEKVAIVTGAGQGIGKGIALCLAKRGVKVIATGRRLEPIEQTIAEIKELGGEGFAMSCDSADRARVDEVVKASVEKYGTIDVVVNNGQAIVPSSPVEETTYDNMLKAWQSGVIGSLNYMQAAFPYMKEQHEGRIINFASATDMFGIAGQLAVVDHAGDLQGSFQVSDAGLNNGLLFLGSVVLGVLAQVAVAARDLDLVGNLFTFNGAQFIQVMNQFIIALTGNNDFFRHGSFS